MKRLLLASSVCLTPLGAAASSISILPGGPLPLPEEEATVSTSTRTSLTDDTGRIQTVALNDLRTVDSSLSSGFTSIGGSVDGQQLQTGRPDRVEATATIDDEVYFYEGVANANTLVTVPNLIVSPEVQTEAEVSITRQNDLTSGRRGDASASGAMAYQAKITRLNTASLGFDIDFAPIDVTIKADMSAFATAGDPSDFTINTFATASVVTSSVPITVNPSGGLEFDVDNSLILFSESVSALSNGKPSETLDDKLKTTTFNASIPVDTNVYLGKTATSTVAVNASSNDTGKVTGSAQAVIDPVLSFDQVSFDLLYGDDCMKFLGSTCPDMSTLFSLSLSPFVGNGFATLEDEPVDGPAPVPLPASAWALLAGVASLRMLSRKSARPVDLA